MHKCYDTVIFDMDGTLLDTLDDLTDSVNATLNKFGRPERTKEEIRRFVGNGVERLINLAVPEETSSEDVHSMLEWFKTYYGDHSRIKTKVYDGMIDVLENLKENNYQTAIVSNKFDAAVRELSRLYFGDLIDVAIGENEAAGIHKKPSKDTVVAALQALGTKREQALYVGDSEVDYETAMNAEMDCLLVSWGFRERQLLEGFEKNRKNPLNHHKKNKVSTRVRVVDTPKEIIAWLENNDM